MKKQWFYVITVFYDGFSITSRRCLFGKIWTEKYTYSQAKKRLISLRELALKHKRPNDQYSFISTKAIACD